MATQIFFYFHPDPWGMIQFDEHIFQMVWFNHHLEIISNFFLSSSWKNGSETIHSEGERMWWCEQHISATLLVGYQELNRSNLSKTPMVWARLIALKFTALFEKNPQNTDCFGDLPLRVWKTSRTLMGILVAIFVGVHVIDVANDLDIVFDVQQILVQ